MKVENMNNAFYTQIQKEIDRVEKKSDLYRLYYYFFRASLIILAGVITVVSGLKGVNGEENFIFNVILVLGAISAAFTSFDTLFQVETKKNTYKLMLVELRDIRSEVVYYYEHQPKDLENRIKEHMFPRYQATIALAKGLIEKDQEKTPE